MVSIISSLELHIHQINCCSCTSDEEDFHGGVVERDEASEQVEVPSHEHHQEQDLGLSRNSGTASCLPDLEQEENYG